MGLQTPHVTANRDTLPRAASHPSHLSFLVGFTHALAVVPYLVALALIVHSSTVGASLAGTAAPTNQQKAANTWPLSDPLPPAAEDMRQAILTAVHAGSIDELKVAYDLGELRADIGDGDISDPVTYWKKQSADGAGREILAILSDLLAVGPAQVARGRDPENNAVYVWPYLAELPLDKLTPAQHVDLLRLMPANEAKAMIEKKTWTWWRLTIGADGLWHAFRKGP